MTKKGATAKKSAPKQGSSIKSRSLKSRIQSAIKSNTNNAKPRIVASVKKEKKIAKKITEKVKNSAKASENKALEISNKKLGKKQIPAKSLPKSSKVKEEVVIKIEEMKPRARVVKSRISKRLKKEVSNRVK